MNADQHLQRLLLRPVHAQLRRQAQDVDRELERLVPLIRRRRPLPPRRGPGLRRRQVLPARRHLPELLHGNLFLSCIAHRARISALPFHRDSCSAVPACVATKCWTAALRVSIDAASRPCIPAAAFLNSESCRCSIMEGPTSTAAQGDPSSLRATTTMPPSTSTVRIIGSFRFASAALLLF